MMTRTQLKEELDMHLEELGSEGLNETEMLLIKCSHFIEDLADVDHLYSQLNGNVMNECEQLKMHAEEFADAVLSR